MILPPSLSIEDQHLVEVEGGLGKIIKLDGTSHGNVRVIQPQFCRMQHSGGEVVMDILGQKRVRPFVASVGIKDTYEAKSEVYGIVYERPALLGEPQYASMYPARVSF